LLIFDQHGVKNQSLQNRVAGYKEVAVVIVKSRFGASVLVALLAAFLMTALAATRECVDCHADSLGERTESYSSQWNSVNPLQLKKMKQNIARNS